MKRKRKSLNETFDRSCPLRPYPKLSIFGGGQDSRSCHRQPHRPRKAGPINGGLAKLKKLFRIKVFRNVFHPNTIAKPVGIYLSGNSALSYEIVPAIRLCGNDQRGVWSRPKKPRKKNDPKQQEFSPVFLQDVFDHK